MREYYIIGKTQEEGGRETRLMCYIRVPTDYSTVVAAPPVPIHFTTFKTDILRTSTYVCHIDHHNLMYEYYTRNYFFMPTQESLG